mgnify:CR=1 FL=1
MELKSLLWTLVLAMAPVSELRGAIPYGLAHDIPLGLLLPLCVAANLLPVPLIVLFLRKILAWMQRLGGKPKALAEWLIARGFKKTMMVKKYETLGLFLLVAIPLPGTGAWTGALVAALMGLRMKFALPAIAGGVAAAGVLVTLVCRGVLHIAGL